MTNPRRWYYCVIQYCPDFARDELVAEPKG